MGGAAAVIGVVGKPFGVRGEVHLQLDPDLEVDLDEGTVVQDDGGRELVVASARWHGTRLLVAFEGVADRDAAERLRGVRLLLPREQIPLAEGARWVDELLGAEVVDAAGEAVGVLERVEDGAAHDLLVIARPDGGEVLVPAVDELVDLSGQRIVVQPLPGLLDPDEALPAEPGEPHRRGAG